MSHLFCLVSSLWGFSPSCRLQLEPVKLGVPLHHHQTNVPTFLTQGMSGFCFGTRHAVFFSSKTNSKVSSIPQGGRAWVNQSDCESQRPSCKPHNNRPKLRIESIGLMSHLFCLVSSLWGFSPSCRLQLEPVKLGVPLHHHQTNVPTFLTQGMSGFCFGTRHAVFFSSKTNSKVSSTTPIISTP